MAHSASIENIYSQSDDTQNGTSDGEPSLAQKFSDGLLPTEMACDFAALDDGTLIELVRSGGGSGNNLQLLVWNGGLAYKTNYLDHGGYRFIPPKIDEKFCNLNLLLPTGVGPRLSGRELFLKICHLISLIIDVPQRLLRLIAAFAIATWFIEKTTAAPYLFIYGPPESGKSTLLRLLHCLCRRAVLTAGSIPPAMFSELSGLHPTQLLDEVEFTGSGNGKAFACWLRAGNAPGAPVAVAGQLVDSFGAKVVCSRQSVADRSLASRGLHISMLPTQQRYLLAPEQDLLAELSQLQNSLLRFRLEHYDEFLPEECEQSFRPRMQVIAEHLLLPFLDDETTKQELLESLVEQGERAAAETREDYQYSVVRELFTLCHQNGVKTALVGQVAAHINCFNMSFGEEADVKPRKVGAVMKSLGLMTDKLGNIGRGIKLTRRVRTEIHQLFKGYGVVPSPGPLVANCSLCEQFFGMSKLVEAKRKLIEEKNKQAKDSRSEKKNVNV